MLERLECVALRTVKYSDRSSILGAYTARFGRVALAVPATDTPSARRVRALVQPLSRFECVADMRPGQEIHRMRDIQPVGAAPSADPVRGVMRMFAADLLASLLREPMADPLLYAFVADSARRLDEATPRALANFHLAFMMQLMHFLGVEPDTSTYSPGSVFDMADGVWRTSAPLHRRYLAGDEARAAFILTRLNYRNARCFSLSRRERNDIIDRLLEYFNIHFPHLGTLHSIDVLRSVFNF